MWMSRRHYWRFVSRLAKEMLIAQIENYSNKISVIRFVHALGKITNATNIAQARSKISQLRKPG